MLKLNKATLLLPLTAPSSERKEQHCFIHTSKNRRGVADIKMTSCTSQYYHCQSDLPAHCCYRLKKLLEFRKSSSEYKYSCLTHPIAERLRRITSAFRF